MNAAVTIEDDIPAVDREPIPDGTDNKVKQQIAMYCNLELGESKYTIPLDELLNYVSQKDRHTYESEFKAS